MWFDRVVIGTERRTVWIGNEDFSDGDDNVIQQQQAQALPVGDDNEDDEDHEANNNNNNHGGGGRDPLEGEGEPEPERLLEERPIRVELSAFAEVLPRGCDEMQFHCCTTGHIFWDVFNAPSPPCLRVLVALTSLDMFECRGIDAYAVAALSKWLSDPTKSTRLERLKIQYGFVEDGGGADNNEGEVRVGIADPILEALDRNTTLQELTIRTGHLPLRIGPGAAKAIGRSQTLQRLTLSGLNIPSVDATALARCLQGNDARLQHLELASAATEIPCEEFYELVKTHNWHLESVTLAGVSEESQRRLDHWTATVNPIVRRVHDGWETHIVSRHFRRRAAETTSRVTTSTTTSPSPTSSSSSTSSSSPVLKLLPVALHSLQSKPDLTYKLLRGRHLEELVAHWPCRSQLDRHQPPTKPPPQTKSGAKNETRNFPCNVTSSECRTPRNRRSGSGGGGGVDRTRSIPRHPTPRR